MKGQNGITLVALIITIIVLLILAIVSIGAITNTGILPKSQNAVDAYKGAEGNETNTLTDYETYLQNAINAVEAKKTNG